MFKQFEKTNEKLNENTNEKINEKYKEMENEIENNKDKDLSMKDNDKITNAEKKIEEKEMNEPVNTNNISMKSSKSIAYLNMFVETARRKIQKKGTNEIESVDEAEEVKFHIYEMIKMLQFENQKNINSNKKIKALNSLIQKIFEFCRKIMMLLKDNKNLSEDLNQEFFQIRKELPKEIDSNPKEFFKETKSKRKKGGKVRKSKTHRVFSAPKLGVINRITYNEKITNPGFVLANKVKVNSGGKLDSYKGLWQTKIVLKLLTQLYDERAKQYKENPVLKDPEMQIFVYNHFLNRHGMKKVAEQKYLLFCLSVKKNIQIFRVNVFARHLNLLDDYLNYSVDESRKYIEGLENLLANVSMGTPIPHNEADIKRLIPYLRGLDYLKVFSENKLTHDEMIDLKKEIDLIKESDPKNINKAGILDIDLFLSLMVKKYRHLVHRTAEYVITAFNSADLDGNRKIKLEEFALLYRHIEKQKFNEEKVVELFQDNADLITDEEKSMSFEKFTAVCVDYSLFSSEKQNIFLGLQEGTEEEVFEEFEKVKENWLIKKDVLNTKLFDLKNNLETYIFEEWVYIIDVVEKRINKEGEKEYKAVLIALKILSNEIDRLNQSKLEEEMKEADEDDEDESEPSEKNFSKN